MLLSLLPLAAACAGGGSASRTVPLPEGAPFDSQRAIGERDIRSEAATPVPVSSDLLYVGNTGNNSITVYHHDASGNTAPLKIIAGSKTGITSPGQLSEDAEGNLYVANAIPSSVLVFAHGANGNVAPIRKLAGPLAGLTSETSVYSAIVDPTTGKLFVDTQSLTSPYAGVGQLMRFPPNANGNEAPYAAANGVYGPLAFRSDGNTIIASFPGDCCSENDDGITSLPKQFPSHGGAATTPSLSGFAPSGIADDATSKTFLASCDSCGYFTSGIYRFDEDTTGHLSYAGYPDYTPPIVSVITSASDCTSLALGYLRNIYAVCGSAVNVYEPDTSGAAKPLRVLSGPKTLLNSPVGIYEGK